MTTIYITEQNVSFKIQHHYFQVFYQNQQCICLPIRNISQVIIFSNINLPNKEEEANDLLFPANNNSTHMELPSQSGIEPDYCFYIDNWQAVIGRDRLTWGSDTSPDLAIEIDVTSYTDVNDYTPYRIPEVWILSKVLLITSILL
jgi:Uma2 family endonuclease